MVDVKIASNQHHAGSITQAATNGTRLPPAKLIKTRDITQPRRPLYKLSTVPARESGIVTDLTTLQNGDKVVASQPRQGKGSVLRVQRLL
ncbi:MAG: hypothetical protein V8S97_04940 [Oscillospiraceae bacterium]